MKYCPYCKINVGGDFDTCPLCQNQLTGEATEKYWPSPYKPKKSNHFFKIQFFIAAIACLTMLFVDFWLDENPHLTWSTMYVFWIVVGEITLRVALNYRHNPYGVVTGASLTGIGVLMVSSIWFPALLGIIPIPLMCIVVMNFIVMLVDTSGDSMIHFIGTFITVIISWLVVIVFMKSELIILWKVCLMVSLVTILGTLIFKGRMLITQLKKLFTM